MKPILLDTSVIVALMDRGERYHSRCVEIVKLVPAPLVTCEAVIAESSYLLRSTPRAVEAILENVARGVFQIGFDLSFSAAEIRRLMKQYRSVPMDFADACLVCLAREFDTGRILTLDSDFSIYRWAGNKKFELLIDLD